MKPKEYQSPLPGMDSGRKWLPAIQLGQRPAALSVKSDVSQCPSLPHTHTHTHLGVSLWLGSERRAALGFLCRVQNSTTSACGTLTFIDNSFGHPNFTSGFLRLHARSDPLPAQPSDPRSSTFCLHLLGLVDDNPERDWRKKRRKSCYARLCPLPSRVKVDRMRNFVYAGNRGLPNQNGATLPFHFSPAPHHPL